MQFRTLFTVSISHKYYLQGCKDFSFIIPSDSAQLLTNGKLIAKIREGILYVLFAADEPEFQLTGKTLSIGLKLLNPFFSNFTDLDFNTNSFHPLYTNATNPEVLDGGIPVTLVGRVFSYSLSNTTRPLTVMLKNADGQILQTDTIADDRANITYDLNGQTAGVYTVTEADSESIKTVNYYSSLELQREGIFGVLAITIADSFYTNPRAFTLSFAAKEETLKYYVVGKNYSDADIEQLAVADGGEEGRSPINFTKVLAADFTDEDISPSLLGNGDAKIALFKSQTPLPRQEKARQKIQLRHLQQKDGEVEERILIPHLPQPSGDRTNADLIIQLTKPKP
ncbi:hypothetical protein [Calothrix sp. NIES-2098]|uniref:hypothetical protein n=1 Tax=Calothrix sp. NIES-2098 TaxID=1954171 RepID=UPI000B61B57A|nr:hypothetical protein NIES2098_30420 [Calothrix sp. NIES-2098]